MASARVRVQTGIAKFIALAFTFSSELEILSFHVEIVHAGTTTKKLYGKKHAHVQSCRFAYFNTHSLVDIVVAVVVLKGAGATRTAKEQ